MALVLPLLVAAGTATPAAAQWDAPIETDRPDFTDGTATVPGGHTQLEAGYTFAPDDRSTEHTLGELLIRIGFASRAEFRVGFDSYAWSRGPAGPQSGFTDTSLGVKLRLLRSEAGSFLPSITLLGASSLPTGARTFGDPGAQPEAKLAVGWRPTDRLDVASNLNYTYASGAEARFHRLSGSLALDYDWTRRIGSYVEGYGFAPRNADDVDVAYLNGGLTYRVSPALQLDARAGVRAHHVGNRFFGIGLSYRW